MRHFTGPTKENYDENLMVSGFRFEIEFYSTRRLSKFKEHPPMMMIMIYVSALIASLSLAPKMATKKHVAR